MGLGIAHEGAISGRDVVVRERRVWFGYSKLRATAARWRHVWPWPHREQRRWQPSHEKHPDASPSISNGNELSGESDETAEVSSGVELPSDETTTSNQDSVLASSSGASTFTGAPSSSTDSDEGASETSTGAGPTSDETENGTSCATGDFRCEGHVRNVCADGIWLELESCSGGTPFCTTDGCMGTQLTGGLTSVAQASAVNLVRHGFEYLPPLCGARGKDIVCVEGGIHHE